MKRLLRTNSKEYIKNVEDYIFNCIDLDCFELESNEISKKEMLILVSNEIKKVAFYSNNMRKFKNNKDEIIADYLQGLPSFLNIDFENYNILKVAAKLHNINKIPDNKEDVILNNWFLHIANKFIALCGKYDIKF